MKTMNLAIAIVTLVGSLVLPGMAEAAQECLARMKTGKYEGQCLDTSHKRAIHLLSTNADTVTISNFRKNGHFYKAIIPIHDIESVSYIVVDLNAHPLNTLGFINVSHSQLRFRLKRNSVIELYDLQTPLLSADSFVDTERDFLVSLNYMAPAGVIYNPVKGFNEELYASALQVYSLSDELKTRFTSKLKFNMYEIPLNLNSREASDVVMQALKVSDQQQYNIPYDTWSSNCTTMVFDLLDQGLELKNQKPYRFKVLQAHDLGMIPAFKALGQRGLVEDNTKIKLLNTEFGYPLFPGKSNRYFARHVGMSYRDVK